MERLVRPAWLTDDVEAMIARAKLKGWTVWHWPAGDTSAGETALISGGYDAAGIRARWKDIREGCGGENEPFLGLDRLREISETNASAMAPPPQRLPSTKDVAGG
jgi:hypothetical protein